MIRRCQDSNPPDRNSHGQHTFWEGHVERRADPTRCITMAGDSCEKPPGADGGAGAGAGLADGVALPEMSNGLLES